MTLLTLVLAWAAGLVLGAMFFGGLWWTVRRASSSRRPALWFFGSLLLRMSIAAGRLLLRLGRAHWERLLLCLLGFVMARLRRDVADAAVGEKPRRPTQEASHAP